MILTIEKELFAVSLPTSDEWDAAIKAGAFQDWLPGQPSAWCRDMSKTHDGWPVLRGFRSASMWGEGNPHLLGKSVGFYPVLYPVNTDTGYIDRTLFQSWNGCTICMGNLSLDGLPVRNVPAQYPRSAKVQIRDEAATLQWYVFDGIMIATSPILTDISWADLQALGFTEEPPNAASKKAANEAAPKTSKRMLAGGYALLEMTDVKTHKKQTVAIKEDFLLRSFFAPFHRPIFLDETDMGMALNSRAIAFIYHPEEKAPFEFPRVCRGDAMLAFVDFLRRNNDASKCLDGLLSD